MGKTEVTRTQWYQVMGKPSDLYKVDGLPVVNESWDRCMEFCRWLTDRESQAGRLPQGYAYRLPTEAEWEFAARGGVQSRSYVYSGGDNIDEVGWYIGNSDRKVKPVGLKKANELGLHDMSGNVREWCHDWCQDGYGGLGDIDPSGPQSGRFHVYRGGYWGVVASSCQPTYRYNIEVSNLIGFRVVLAPKLSASVP